MLSSNRPLNNMAGVIRTPQRPIHAGMSPTRPVSASPRTWYSKKENLSINQTSNRSTISAASQLPTQSHLYSPHDEYNSHGSQSSESSSTSSSDRDLQSPPLSIHRIPASSSRKGVLTNITPSPPKRDHNKGTNISLMNENSSGPRPGPISKIVRIYLCYKGKDFDDERRAIRQNVYPEIKEFCHSKGLEFQLVDVGSCSDNNLPLSDFMRDLHLHEIEKCRTMSRGPHCLLLVDKGLPDHTLPRRIKARDFEIIQSSASELLTDTLLLENIVKQLSYLTDNSKSLRTANKQVQVSTSDCNGAASTADNSNYAMIKTEHLHRLSLLKTWYVKDENAIPAEYLLQAPDSVYTHVYDTDENQAKDEELSIWCTVQEQLHLALAIGLHQARQKGTPSRREIRLVSEYAGIIQNAVAHRDNARLHGTIVVERVASNSLCPRENMNVANSTSPCVSDVFNGLQESNKICLQVPEEIHENEDVQECYIHGFCDQVFRRLSYLVQQTSLNMKQTEKEAHPTKQEISHHNLVAEQYQRTHFNHELLNEIKEKLRESASPLVLYGPTGCGKATLALSVIRRFPTWFQYENNKCIEIVRFCGASTQSMCAASMLKSVCDQLTMTVSDEQSNQNISFSLHEQSKHFLALLSKVKRPTIIVFASLENLQPMRQAEFLTWIPLFLPKTVKILVTVNSDSGRSTLTNLHKRLQDNTRFLEVPLIVPSTALSTLNNNLRLATRNLIPLQKDNIISLFQKSGSSILLMIQISEARRWHSYTHFDEVTMLQTLKVSVNDVLEDAEMKLGKLFVSHALLYLTVSRIGLSETELVNILETDFIVMAEVEGLTSSLPQFSDIKLIVKYLIVKLLLRLQDYLISRNNAGQFVISLKYATLGNIVRQRYMMTKDSIKLTESSAHACLGQYFMQRIIVPLDKCSVVADVNKETPGSCRALSEISYHLVQAKSWTSLFQSVVCNIVYVTRKIATFGLSALCNDYDFLLERNPNYGLAMIRRALCLYGRQLAETKTLNIMTSVLLPDTMSHPDTVGIMVSSIQEHLYKAPENGLLPAFTASRNCPVHHSFAEAFRDVHISTKYNKLLEFDNVTSAMSVYDINTGNLIKQHTVMSNLMFSKDRQINITDCDNGIIAIRLSKEYRTIWFLYDCETSHFLKPLSLSNCLESGISYCSEYAYCCTNGGIYVMYMSSRKCVYQSDIPVWCSKSAMLVQGFEVSYLVHPDLELSKRRQMIIFNIVNLDSLSLKCTFKMTHYEDFDINFTNFGEEADKFIIQYTLKNQCKTGSSISSQNRDTQKLYIFDAFNETFTHDIDLPGRPTHVMTSAAVELILLTYPGRAVISSMKDGSVVGELEGKDENDVILLHDYTVVSYSNNHIDMRSCRTGEFIASSKLEDMGEMLSRPRLAITNDNKFLVMAAQYSSGYNVKIWNIRNLANQGKLTEKLVDSIVYSSRTKQCVGVNDRGQIGILDLSSPKSSCTWQFLSVSVSVPVRRVSLSQDGKLLLCLGDRELLIVDLASATIKLTWRPNGDNPGDLSSGTVSSDNTQIAFTEYIKKSHAILHICDLNIGEEVRYTYKPFSPTKRTEQLEILTNTRVIFNHWVAPGDNCRGHFRMYEVCFNNSRQKRKVLENVEICSGDILCLDNSERKFALLTNESGNSYVLKIIEVVNNLLITTVQLNDTVLTKPMPSPFLDFAHQTIMLASDSGLWKISLNGKNIKLLAKVKVQQRKTAKNGEVYTCLTSAGSVLLINKGGGLVAQKIPNIVPSNSHLLCEEDLGFLLIHSNYTNNFEIWTPNRQLRKALGTNNEGALVQSLCFTATESKRSMHKLARRLTSELLVRSATAEDKSKNAMNSLQQHGTAYNSAIEHVKFPVSQPTKLDNPISSVSFARTEPDLSNAFPMNENSMPQSGNLVSSPNGQKVSNLQRMGSTEWTIMLSDAKASSSASHEKLGSTSRPRHAQTPEKSRYSSTSGSELSSDEGSTEESSDSVSQSIPITANIPKRDKKINNTDVAILKDGEATTKSELANYNTADPRTIKEDKEYQLALESSSESEESGSGSSYETESDEEDDDDEEDNGDSDNEMTSKQYTKDISEASEMNLQTKTPNDVSKQIDTEIVKPPVEMRTQADIHANGGDSSESPYTGSDTDESTDSASSVVEMTTETAKTGDSDQVENQTRDSTSKSDSIEQNSGLDSVEIINTVGPADRQIEAPKSFVSKQSAVNYFNPSNGSSVSSGSSNVDDTALHIIHEQKPDNE